MIRFIIFVCAIAAAYGEGIKFVTDANTNNGLQELVDSGE